MKAEERDDPPFDEGDHARPFPRINQLAKISFFIGIGDILAGVYILYGGPDLFEFFLLALFLTAAFGAFCGHWACKQIRARRPYQRGKAMAVIGMIGCYICIGWGTFGFWLLTQYYIA